MTTIKFFFLLILLQTNLFAQDTIPFKIGDNNKIYIKVSVNNSDELNFMYDTGADECVIKKSILDKRVNIKIDGKDENIGLGGVTTIETSSKNEIKINSLNKNNQLLAVLDYEDEIEDGIIGWKYFEDKIVNINYGIKKIIIYDRLPEIPEGYMKLKSKLIDSVYYIKLTLLVKGNKITDWFEFDTGSSSSLIINNNFVKKHKLIGKMAKIGNSESKGSDENIVKSDLVLINELRIKDYRFYRIPIDLITTESESAINNNGIIGNNFLKRFHTILDFKNDAIYMKVNNLVHSRYLESLIK